jgi:formylglycine-generating enzyme required for sulfatase activity
MVLIPPGEFLLWEGTTAVLSRPFRLSATEVTREQFDRFVQATGHVTASEKDPRGGGR